VCVDEAGIGDFAMGGGVDAVDFGVADKGRERVGITVIPSLSASV